MQKKILAFALVTGIPISWSPLLAQDSETSAVNACHSERLMLRRLACYDASTGFSLEAQQEEVAGQASQLPADTSPQETGFDPTPVLALIENLQFSEALLLIETDVSISISEDTLAELETATLEAVRPIPAGNAEDNLFGYELLQSLDPHNQDYEVRANQYREALAAQRSAVLQRMTPERDDFRNITFLMHDSEPRYIDTRSRISLYIADHDNFEPVLRVKSVYTNDSWLFVDRLELSIDGQIVQFTQGEFDRDNDSEIWEWRDEAATAAQLGVLGRIAQAERVIMRFTGQQYYDEMDLAREDRTMIRDVLLAFEVLQEEDE